MSILTLRILGIFVGLNYYLYTNRIYEDDMKLREHGSVIPMELPLPLIMFRMLKVYLHTWFLYNI